MILRTLFTLFAAATLLAASPATRKAAAPALATPALWAVKDADTTIYLFGTVHLLPKGVNWLHGPVKQAFDAADTLVLETLLPDDPSYLAPLVRDLGLNPPGVALSSLIDPKLKPALAKAAADIKMPVQALEPMRPWLAATMLAAGGFVALGFDPALGVEKRLTTAAQQSGKQLAQLETPEQQMRFIAELPEADQKQMISATLTDWGTLKPLTDRMLRSWTSGNVEQVGLLMNESLNRSPTIAKVLITDRNVRWAEWISARMQQPGTVFVAVGAGHLTGPDSVKNLLAKQGLAVERLNQSAAQRTGR
jgi:uncharacterized protein